MTARISIDGLPELKAAFEALPAAVKDEALAKALPVAAANIRDSIKGMATFGPYSTGALRESIVARETRLAGERSALVVPSRKRGSGGAHAHLVEYGTRSHGGHPGTQAQPFFGPGADAAEESAMKTLEDAVSEAITKTWAQNGGEV